MKRGDTVKIVGGAFGDKVGEILSILENGYSIVQIGNHPHFVGNEYLEPVEDPTMKVGDRVRYTGMGLYKDLEGTIVSIHNNGDISVNPDDMTGHKCFYSSNLELVEEPTMEVGDRVELTCRIGKGQIGEITNKDYITGKGYWVSMGSWGRYVKPEYLKKVEELAMKVGDKVKFTCDPGKGKIGEIIKVYPNTNSGLMYKLRMDSGRTRRVRPDCLKKVEDPNMKVGDIVKTKGPSGYSGLTGKVREIFNHGEIVVRLDGYSTDTCFHPRYLELVEDPNMNIEQRLDRLEEAVGIGEDSEEPDEESPIEVVSYDEVRKETISKSTSFHCKVEQVGRIVLLKWYKFPYMPEGKYMLDVDGWRINFPVSTKYVQKGGYPVQKISKGSKEEAAEFFDKLVVELSEFADNITKE